MTALIYRVYWKLSRKHLVELVFRKAIILKDH